MKDTIAAISTPFSVGAIGIVRISGDKAFDIADKIFKGNRKVSELKSHTVSYGKIIDYYENTVLDEVLLLKMNAPNTFTKENTIEINCHGSLIVLKKVLELIIREGARLADPGEFTKRAFLNGRIDLAQAEAVIDLINSKTNQSAKASITQLEGRLSKKINEQRNELVKLLAHIHVNIDYPEYDIEEITNKDIYEKASKVREELQNIIRNFEKGRIIREGINIVIVGKPNVGKSSLLNELAGKNRAIVTDIPGTTRDVLEEHINIGGVLAKISDTAGIRETEDIVEKIGVEKAKGAMELADLVLCLLDVSKELKEDDVDFIKNIDKRKIVILNKIDLVNSNAIEIYRNQLRTEELVEISLKTGEGIDGIENILKALFSLGEIESNTEILVTHVRHKLLIDKSINSIDEALFGYKNLMPTDLISIDIKNAADFLGEITGESINEEIMNEIFARFCIGK